MNFSVLISVYVKEKVNQFDSAMFSIWDEQTIKPKEIVLVLDGELNQDLYSSIENWKSRIGEALVVVELKKNVGLGKALNIGLDNCSNQLVARMDTDDIASPDRFEKQLAVFKCDPDLSLCGSFVSEFDGEPKNIVSYRRTPISHSDIVRFSKFRNPVNHPTVMFKKDVVLEAGGYLHLMWLEDYYLWIRMLCNGARFYNIDEPLVNMRSGYAQLQRRRGIAYFKSELELSRISLNLGFINRFQFFANILTRSFVRLIPSSLLKFLYKILR